MKMPQFNEEVLRRPETLAANIQKLLDNEALKEFHDVAIVSKMTLESCATNDYLEKIAIESIGARHLTDKLGPDGESSWNEERKGVEAKPKKGFSTSDTAGAVNDDTGNKLLGTHKSYGLIIFLNATKEGTQVNWAVIAPFHYWEQPRFTEIIKHLGISTNNEWKWGDILPADLSERKKCLEDLVKFHKKKHYVRSSPLKLSVLDSIPEDEVVIWKHPDVTWKQVPVALRKKAGQS
jgi:hypothetical protein